MTPYNGIDPVGSEQVAPFRTGPRSKEQGLGDPLIWVRRRPFQPRQCVDGRGSRSFWRFVGEPGIPCRPTRTSRSPPLVRRRLARIAWFQALPWLCSPASALARSAGGADERAAAGPRLVVRRRFIWTVLSDTAFGHVWLARSGLVAVLAVATLAWFEGGGPSRRPRAPWR